MRFTWDQTEAAVAAAWDAFERDDAAAAAPPELERRVFCAVQAAAHRRAHRTFQPYVGISLGIAAATLLIIGVSVWHARPRPREVPAPIASSSAVEETDVVLEPLITLTADRVRDTESLHLVRIRMPRKALAALGMALIEPEATAFVEVDVLVGDDGLPLEVRRIRPIVDASHKY